ncbi:MAG: hypothetical protein BGP11_01560 [Rhodobacterales bacterium 65-51]|uniref:nickel/cobalt transporter n=1 Tax=uncultured Gemmobacter sp. TaxID=1095917 RepID=UPI0009660CEB|nr:hypothetical protein [uncultured Gemmobacter sp.]OJY32684.1 MAG: hypothetical protein BGP11_01560 [Rhodobacterales bacterium 65-51]
MRRGVILFAALLALGLLALWAGGGFTALRLWALAGAREVQQQMAGAVRGIATGAPGALAGLLAVCFAYGFFHAAGPGHGKMLIGSYGMARRVSLIRLAALALLSSLAQATVAVVLVYALMVGLGWARTQIEGVTVTVLAPVSHAMILGIGLWLVWRGVVNWRGQAHPHHDHHHSHGPDCGCGHSHGPTPEQVAQVSGWRDAAALVAGIALRPCSGALFLLVLSWQMGIAAAGVAGVYAMGFGTATVTVAVAASAYFLREGAFEGLSGGRLARAVPMIEIAVGLVVAIVSGGLLISAL